MRQPMVLGNWKMNGRLSEIKLLLDTLKQHRHIMAERSAVLPPSIYLPLVAHELENTGISWGAQNIHACSEGAFTGEISAPMLLDYHCRYVLVGHSERRQLFHEDDKFIAEKFHQVKEHGMIPVLCVGETWAEREQGLTQQVIKKQIQSIEKGCTRPYLNCIIAYEPIWAIGTGKTASPDIAQEVHAFIRQVVSENNADDARALTILYGGSVNAKNASDLFAMPDVDGGLVGGASLIGAQFVEIVQCISSYC